MATYDHQSIEKEAQERFAAAATPTDLSDTSREPYYLLFEFPYPSGDLHVGHWYAYALTDMYARYLRMRGKNVLFPIGFDAFGLPAENAAIKYGKTPHEWTYANMERMRAQIRSIGTTVDWSKEIATCEPSYYRWTQWLFTKLFEHNLAYRKEAPVKWCPKDQTVLANEQVIDGVCERCGTEVEEKRLTQWFLKITEYAERLRADLDALPWREDMKDAQRAWIGKSEGAKLRFQIADTTDFIEVFTTRPDTLFGVTYVVVAPEHALALQHANQSAVAAYLEATKKKSERERMENKEKTGVRIEDVSVLHPITGEALPVFVADYVLGSYGTGAVMAVPAHDERDFAFAQKNALPMKVVILPGSLSNEEKVSCYTGNGVLSNSGTFDGRQNTEAMWDIVQAAGGERTTNYRIRDWLVSRQRYWGCPIPVVYDPEGKPHVVPAEHLPWELPTDVDFVPNGKSPLASSQELHDRVTRIFGEGWTPEYDTLDTFIDSSWYYLRYLDPQNEHQFSSPELMRKWLPVNRYSGGSEHTTMHLLFARFFHKALYDLALVPTSEPFAERFNRGLILGTDGQKMSKRSGNVVNPDEVVQEYGADAVRCYLAFIGPYNEPGHYPWKPEGVTAMRRFLDRVYVLSQSLSDEAAPEHLLRVLATAEAKVAADTERFKLNTALSGLMVALNAFEEEKSVPRAAYHDFLRLLAPFAPHLTDHLFITTGGEGSVHATPWPAYDPALLVSDTMTIVVQVGGKRRGEISIAAGASQDEVLAKALTEAAVTAALGGKEPSRVIYVPGKLLNLVV